jgi:parallel beta-helix repeat protein
MNPARRFAAVTAVVLVPAFAVVAIAHLAAQQAPQAVPQPVPGRNVNVLGGPTWVTSNPFEIVGDPWRTQTVESDCDVSTRNPSVIVCSAVDYRLVDVPGGFFTPLDATGSAPPHPDSWNMIAQSRDNGMSWMSRPHPGHPLDTSGAAPMLKGYQFGTDARVRFGAAGAMLHVGLAANRGDNALSAVYSSTWIHLNNHEYDPEPVKFTGVVSEIMRGNSGQFRDRPHLTMGEPNGQICSFEVPVKDESGVTRTVHQALPCTTAYVAFATFVGDGALGRTKVQFTKSTDLGRTWSKVLFLSEQVGVVSQGAHVVKIPGTNRLIVVWRRGAMLNQTDAIMMAVSNDDGSTFTKATVLSEIVPFDQGTTPYSFRVKTMVTTAAATGAAYVVWADRRNAAGAPDPHGEARVVYTVTDGVTMTTPKPVEASRPSEAMHDCWQSGADARCWGHQIFPSVAVAAGRVHIGWTDFRNDASGVFDPEKIDEYANAHVGGTRHTADVYAAEAALPPYPTSPVFTAPFQVSQYLWGRVPEEGGTLSAEPRQLQYNVKIARNFNTMTVPFDGDYNSSRGEALVPIDPVMKPGVWGFNTGDAATPRAPAFHDFWTDGRNMVLYADEDYNKPRNYTPPDLAKLLTIPANQTSLYDPTQTRPACTAEATGTKNLDIYTARTTTGLYAFAPWNNKTLGYQVYDSGTSSYGQQLVLRAFPVVVENTNNHVSKSFTLTIGNQPTGGFASFDQFWLGRGLGAPVTEVSIEEVPPHSAVAKTVYATSTDPRAAIRVDVTEIGGEGLKTSVFLNPDPTAPDNLLQPGQVDAPLDIARYEVHDASIEGVIVQDINYQKVSGQGAEPGSPAWNTPGWQSPGWQSPGWQSPGWQSPGWQSPGWQSPGWQSPGWQSPGWQSPGWQSPGWQSPGWQSPGWQSPGWQSASFSDGASSRYVIAKVVGKGCRAGDKTCTNTSSAYDANVLVNAADPNLEYQLIVYKLYATPATAGCDHQLVGNTQVVVNIPYYAPGGTSATSASVRSSGPTAAGQPDPRATFTLAPDETAYVVLVAFAHGAGREEFKNEWLPPTNVVFNVPPQAVKTDTYLTYITCGEPGNPPCPPSPPTPAPAPSKPIYIVAPALPWAITQTPYVPQTFQAVGGQGPVTWTAVGLPAGLTIDSATGTLAGTPTVDGAFPFTVTVTDGSPTPLSDTQSFTMRVALRLQITTPASLADAFVGFAYSQTIQAAGGTGTHVWACTNGCSPLQLQGLTWSAATATIAGVPTGRVDSRSMSIRVTDAGPPYQTAARTYALAMPAGPLTYVVSNTNDSGPGSLRQAILYADANTLGADRIQFQIGSGAITIAPSSALPAVTESVTIDGTTQPGFTGTPIVELNGAGAGTTASGLRITGDNTTVRGLVVNRFSSDGISIAGGTGHVIAGNYIGTNVAGSSALQNGGNGISVWTPAAGVTIGGSSAADRNVASGNRYAGIFLSGSGNFVRGNYVGTNASGTAAVPNVVQGVAVYNGQANNLIESNVISGNSMMGVAIELGASNNRVRANLIGTDVTGITAIPNGTGVFICYGTATNNTVGGTAPADRNVISGNTSSGVHVCAPGNSVLGNLVGTTAAGLAGGALPNGVGVTAGDGYGGQNTAVGGTAPGAGNVIAFNAHDGVAVAGNASGSSVIGNTITQNGGLGVSVTPQMGYPGGVATLYTPTGVSVLDNQIWSNGGAGITLTGGSNNSQLAPGITDAWSIGGNTGVSGSLGPGLAVGTAYTIQLFRNAACDGSGAGEGETLLQSFAVTASAGGFATFSRTFAAPSAVGSFVTATATNTTTGDTSQFSTCFAVPAPTNLSAVLTPVTVIQGNPAEVNVPATVTPGQWPTSSSLTVSMDGSAVGRGTIVFRNDATGCDDTSLDNTYFACLNVPYSVAPGTYSLPFTLTDAEGRTFASTVAVTVLPAVNGTILGTLVDASDGVLPGFTVRFRNNATLTVYSAITQGDGSFALPDLPAGYYTMITPYTKPWIMLSSGQTLSLGHVGP